MRKRGVRGTRGRAGSENEGGSETVTRGRSESWREGGERVRKRGEE